LFENPSLTTLRANQTQSDSIFYSNAELVGRECVTTITHKLVKLLQSLTYRVV